MVLHGLDFQVKPVVAEILRVSLTALAVLIFVEGYRGSFPRVPVWRRYLVGTQQRGR